jgi:hypothetical protein
MRTNEVFFDLPIKGNVSSNNIKTYNECVFASATPLDLVICPACSMSSDWGTKIAPEGSRPDIKLINPINE